ncbi:TPA: hypothetical protein NIH14_001826 [Pseudomonas aeruginosa]|nr:hypothetical protein [Pseudomonas aeruginosa]
MSIDWSKAPEGCIGAFARIISKTAFFVFSKRPSDYSSREGYEGEGEDGPYHVFSEYWEWIDKPWDGQGLPPVGVRVSIFDDGGLVYGHGESGEVIAHVEDCAVIRMSYGLGCFTAKNLRTPEQIAAEEREKAVREMLALDEYPHGQDRGGMMSRADFCRVLYNAGYRRQEEGK